MSNPLKSYANCVTSLNTIFPISQLENSDSQEKLKALLKASEELAQNENDDTKKEFFEAIEAVSIDDLNLWLNMVDNKINPNIDLTGDSTVKSIGSGALAIASFAVASTLNVIPPLRTHINYGFLAALIYIPLSFYCLHHAKEALLNFNVVMTKDQNAGTLSHFFHGVKFTQEPKQKDCEKIEVPLRLGLI